VLDSHLDTCTAGIDFKFQADTDPSCMQILGNTEDGINFGVQGHCRKVWFQVIQYPQAVNELVNVR
jgi:hypothetical protein